MNNIRILIIEDEPATARQLKFIIEKSQYPVSIIAVIDSVEDSLNFFKTREDSIDLIFMDIELSDGNSFEIFESITIKKPIIFVTAYNDFAIQAFKNNGIDYVLKPFLENDIFTALNKFDQWFSIKSNENVQMINLQNMLSEMQVKRAFQETFLVYAKDKMIPLKTEDINYFYSENEIVKAFINDKKSFVIDYTLEKLETLISPKSFFRANRQFIIQKKAIVSISTYYNSRLLVKITPELTENIIISKAKATEFKNWVNQ